jgi:predicted HTH transcriptional regulator
MNQAMLEGLLYQNESETLDFKVAQYPFDKASDEQKSELLKDILAFANAWRQSDAHILIGVEEVKGGRSIVRGTATPLLNRNLQQSVHSKTNRPVSFAYSTEKLDGKAIGVITVPLQDRPLFLKKDFGNQSQCCLHQTRRHHC